MQSLIAPLRIMIVDDNPLLCDGLEAWLTHEQGIESVRCQIDWRRAEEEARSRRPDVILLDIDLPGINGLDLIAPLLAAAPEAKVVMLSGLVSGAHVERALDLGASGYIVKDCESTLIAHLIRAAAMGEIALCPAAAAALAGV